MPDLADLYPGFASHCICVASVLHAMDRSNRSEKTDLTSLLRVVEENRVRKS
jgi:hypothetical protein